MQIYLCGNCKKWIKWIRKKKEIEKAKKKLKGIKYKAVFAITYIESNDINNVLNKATQILLNDDDDYDDDDDDDDDNGYCYCPLI